jgi:hypothetical protein
MGLFTRGVSVRPCRPTRSGGRRAGSRVKPRPVRATLVVNQRTGFPPAGWASARPRSPSLRSPVACVADSNSCPALARWPKLCPEPCATAPCTSPPSSCAAAPLAPEDPRQLALGERDRRSIPSPVGPAPPDLTTHHRPDAAGRRTRRTSALGRRRYRCVSRRARLPGEARREGRKRHHGHKINWWLSWMMGAGAGCRRSGPSTRWTPTDPVDSSVGESGCHVVPGGASWGGPAVGQAPRQCGPVG